MQYKALVLDESYFPIQIVEWQHAMRLFFSGRAEVVEHHEDSMIRSPKSSYKVPKVLRIFQKVFSYRGVKFNRHNVFLRDHYACQYCGIVEQEKELTLDHVIPKSRGGKTDWHNIVTCCHTCNNKKADSLLSECRMKLKNKPKVPNWGPFWGAQFSTRELGWWENWIRGQVFKNCA